MWLFVTNSSIKGTFLLPHKTPKHLLQGSLEKWWRWPGAFRLRTVLLLLSSHVLNLASPQTTSLLLRPVIFWAEAVSILTSHRYMTFLSLFPFSLLQEKIKVGTLPSPSWFIIHQPSVRDFGHGSCEWASLYPVTFLSEYVQEEEIAFKWIFFSSSRVSNLHSPYSGLISTCL